LTIGTTTFPEWGPAPNNTTYTPWTTQLNALICPSDGNIVGKGAADLGRSNYRFCTGDSINRSWSRDLASPRGIFGYRSNVSFGAISDGSSNTIMLSERLFGAQPILIRQGIAYPSFDTGGVAVSPAPCLATVDPTNPKQYAGTVANWSGRRWASGMPAYNGFQTVLPPNGPSCGSSSWDEQNVLVTPTSYHPGGVNVAMGDGSVTFISETVNSGDPTLIEVNPGTGGASPYGVWGALGTKAGGEAVSLP
jgi:prepilin-type processing-associated H-X9-DG protein